MFNYLVITFMEMYYFFGVFDGGFYGGGKDCSDFMFFK